MLYTLRSLFLLIKCVLGFIDGLVVVQASRSTSVPATESRVLRELLREVFF